MNKRKTFWFGVQQELPSRDVFPVTIKPPAETEVELTHLVSNNEKFEIILIDGRIGEDLLPFDGPMDLVFFQKHTAFSVGTITPDKPLKLYLQAYGHPSALPHLSFTVVGQMQNWKAPAITAEHQRRIGEVNIIDYKRWLVDQQVKQPQHFLDALETYLAGEDLTPEAKTPGFAALQHYIDVRKQTVEVPTPDAPIFAVNATIIPRTKARTP